MAVESRAPTSDEAVSGTWTGTAGSRYTLVDDFPDTGAADSLVVSTASGGNLTFGFSAFSIASDKVIVKVEVCYRNYKGGANPNAIGGRLKIGGTYYNAATHSPPNGSGNMVLHQDTWTTNPATGSAWTPAEVNAIQAFGWTCTDGAPAITLPDIQLEVSYADIGGTTSSTLAPATVFATGFAVFGSASLNIDPTSDFLAVGGWSGSPRWSLVDDYTDTGGADYTSQTNASTAAGYIEFGIPNAGIPSGATLSSIGLGVTVRSNTAGSTVDYYTRHADGTYRYGTTYTILAANTWENTASAISHAGLTAEEFNGVSGTERIVSIGVWNTGAAGVTLDLAAIRIGVSFVATVRQGFLPNTTLGAATLSAEGEVAAGLNGTLAVTLGAATTTATATVLVSGTLDATTSAATASGTATVLVSGSLDATTGATTLAATGTVEWPPLSASLDSTLGATSIAADGTVAISAALDATAGATVVSATGTVSVSGQCDATLDAIAATITGVVQVDAAEGTAAITLGAISVTASATVLVSGTASIAVGEAAVGSTGTIAIAGESTITLASAAVDSSGTVAVSATLDVTVESATLSATVIIQGDEIEGFSSISLSGSTVAGAVSVMVAGSCDAPVDPITIAASGTVAIDASMIMTVAPAVLAASGENAFSPVTAFLSLTLSSVISQFAAAVEVAGSLSVLLQPATVDTGIPSELGSGESQVLCVSISRVRKTTNRRTPTAVVIRRGVSLTMRKVCK